MGDRGIFVGGSDALAPTTWYDTMDYVTISSAGNATDFGDLLAGVIFNAGCSNGENDRGVSAGGAPGPGTRTNVIEYTTISSGSGTSDFGNLLGAIMDACSFSNLSNERGIFAGGDGPGTTPDRIDTIQYITINTTGNSVDFGNLLDDLMSGVGLSNGTSERGLIAGGWNNSSVALDQIQYITIKSLSGASNFGDLLERAGFSSGCTNAYSARAVLMQGSSNSLDLQYITINSLSNAVDHSGDLNVDYDRRGSTSNGTSDRGLWGGGWDNPNPQNAIDYLTISTTAAASDFGNLTVTRTQLSAYSNAEGTKAVANAVKWQAGVAISNMQYMHTIDRDSIDIKALEAFGMLIPVFVPTPAGGDRGVIYAGKKAGGSSTTIDYITISSAGNATDFGDTSSGGARRPGGSSNGVNDRGVFNKGYASAASNVIEYITILSPANATDFGDLLTTKYGNSGTSNGTNERGIFSPGSGNAVNIEYVTINSASNATDFGDISTTSVYNGVCSNTTNERAVINVSYGNDILEYVTINSASNATDFGDTILYQSVASNCSTSNGTNERGVMSRCVGVNSIYFITISTTGNASDFGDFAGGRAYYGGRSNMENERAVWAAPDTGIGSVGYSDIMEYVTINTAGNASDFGDLTESRLNAAGCSNA